jgi:hypothetical protein
MGLAHEPRFERDHRVLSRGRWSGVQILLGLLIALLPPGWPILVVVDKTTLERRKGARVAAKGMYRDAGLDHNSAHLVQSLRRRSLAEHDLARANPHGPAGLGRICD